MGNTLDIEAIGFGYIVIYCRYRSQWNGLHFTDRNHGTEFYSVYGSHRIELYSLYSLYIASGKSAVRN